MYYDAEEHGSQQLEQVIATIFTCRSVIKYDLSLDEKQKAKMLQDIDASLDVLRGYVPVHPATQPQLTDLSCSQTDSIRVVHANDEALNSGACEILQALYRLYYAYLDTNRQTNLQSFVSRFNEVISVLDNVQRLFEQRQQTLDRYSSPVLLNSSPDLIAIEDLLHKAKIFISDLYYIFMDFIRTLSSILQQNDVHLKTEKLPSLPEHRSERIRRVQLEKLRGQSGSIHSGSLQGIRKAYQQLYRRRLQVESQITEATAFLAFLKEALRTSNVKVHKLNEMLAQTDTISQLLSELFHIIVDYEKNTKI